MGRTVNPRDLREMGRRLEQEYDLITCGYDPAYPDQRGPWIKRHAGEVSRREALRQIREERYKGRPVA
jgi:hypothetical protein